MVCGVLVVFCSNGGNLFLFVAFPFVYRSEKVQEKQKMTDDAVNSVPPHTESDAEQSARYFSFVLIFSYNVLQ